MLGFGCQIFRKRTRELLTILPCHEKSGTRNNIAWLETVITMGDVAYHSIQEVATKLHPRF